MVVMMVAKRVGLMVAKMVEMKVASLGLSTVAMTAVL